MTAAASSADPAPTPVSWDGGDLVLTRVFRAPRVLVFAAWTQPEHYARWFGPHGSTLLVRTMDARPGGALHYCHRLADEAFWIGGVYREVAAPERIAFTCWFSDADGGRVERPGFPAEMTVAVAFAEHPEGTRVTVRQSGLVQDQGEVQGWMDSLDRLATLLADPTPPTKEDR
jgi:uncharacterized protein YndB with AHSA1/START domain